jgi:hypothetical protein
MRKTVVLVIAVASVIGALLPGIASAHDFRSRPKMKLELLPNNPVDAGSRVSLAGRLKGKNLCTNHRQVQLRQRDAGPDTVLDSDRSDNDGEFHFRTTAHNDARVYAWVGRFAERDYQHHHVCLKAKSDNVTINVAG